MNWSEEKLPNESCSYNHITCDTPIGQFIIEWKGWKDLEDYVLMINGNYIGVEWDLNDAKESAKDYIIRKKTELEIYCNHI